MNKLNTTTFALIALAANSALGWSHNEHNVNTTGSEARGVVKVLDGRYDISDQMTWDFSTTSWSQREVSPGQWQTVLRWESASPTELVANTAVGDACFTAVPTPGSGSDPYATIIGAWWTDVNGDPIGTFPTPGASMEVDFPINPAAPSDPIVPEVRIGNAQQVIDPDTGLLVDGVTAPAIQIVGPARMGIFDEPVGPPELWFNETLRPGLEYEGEAVQALGPPDSFFDVWFDIDDAMADNRGGIVQLEPGEDLIGFTYDSVTGPGLLPDLLPGQTLVALFDLGQGNFDSYSFTAPIPEPSSLALLVCVFAGLVGIKRRHR